MRTQLLRPLVGALALVAAYSVQAQFVAYNDHAPGAGTAVNATTWNALGAAPGASGFLKDIQTGANLTVRLSITSAGAIGDAAQAQPAAGTPAHAAFNGFVDFQGSPNPSIELGPGASVTYTLSGLNPNKRYSFKGSAIRGNSAYTDRWTLFELREADAFTAAHSPRVLTSSTLSTLPANAAALNTGVNNTVQTGDVVAWDNIEPGADGIFAVRCEQYTGVVPGGSSAGSKGYGMTAFRLEEFDTVLVPARILTPPVAALVDELKPAAFVVVAEGNPRPSYQWFRGELPIPNATNAIFSLPQALLSDNGASFKVRVSNTVSNVAHVVVTDPVVLQVRADTNAPSLLAVEPVDLSHVELLFSEPITPSTATNLGNYTITGPNGTIALRSATLGGAGDKILLEVAPMTENIPYTVTISGLRDRSAAGNSTAPALAQSFTPATYRPVDIGAAVEGHSITAVDGGYDVVGGGVGISTTRDQFLFAHQLQTGNFDIRVRVADLGITDAYVKAGLMARESAADNARFSAVFASSAQLGSVFSSRGTTGTSPTVAAPALKFPANYPWAWLRLRRSGNEFAGFGSLDGHAWQQLGSVNLTLPNQLLFGMAVSSERTNALTTAKFRDIGPTTPNPTTLNYNPQREPIGPSNRRTGLIFSEIMHSPRERADGKNLEFIEIYNGETIFADLTGWKITRGVDFNFPDGFRLEAGAFVVIAADPDAIKQAYGITNVLGPFTGRLSGSGETLLLANKAGARRAELTYSTDAPWPPEAAGGGHSIVCLRPSYGEDDIRAWGSSELIGGSPGYDDPTAPTSLRGVVINEILASPTEGQSEFIELYNASNSSVDLSGAFLTDDAATNKFRIPNGTQLGARQWLQFNTADLGFGLSSSGETIFLISPDESRVLDALQFGGQEAGVSFGRSPDGGPKTARLAQITQASANAMPRQEEVVISEIMYEPLTGEQDDQYVELFNRTSNPINVSGWHFDDGITFAFPFGSTIPAGSYVVVAKNPDRLLTNHPHLSRQNTFGPFSGNLDGGGERLAFAKTTMSGNDVIAVSISEVTYRTGGRWPELANGGGSSLELRDTNADTTEAANWAASDETQKSPWQTYEVTGTLNLANPTFPANKAYLLSLGGGEYLVDDLEVLRADGVNLLTNAGFELGQTGWNFYGNHITSAIVPSAAASGVNGLHIRAQDVGDQGPNSIRGTMTATLGSNAQVTLRAKVRWLSGWPEILFRVRGNGVELPISVPPPLNLGTPGLPNSRRVNNAGPAISDVAHFPPVPAPGQPVLVIARISDPDGVPVRRLMYRVDPSATTTTVQMRDDGLSGDLLAGDGVYSGVIPASSGVVAFHIQAQDGAAVASASRYPNDAPARECLVRWGDPAPAGTIPNYHLWMTAASSSDLSTRPGLDRKYRDCTVVYHNRVIYNAGIRNKGSPFHSGVGSFSTTYAGDDLLLGDDKNVFSSTGNGGVEPTQMATDTAYWMASELNVPFNHSHYVRLYRNGSLQYPVSYNRETPSRGTADDWFGGGGLDDTLYKIAIWFEFDDNNGNGTSARLDATFSKKPTTAPPFKQAAYRWNWQSHPGGRTFNSYQVLFDLIAAANAQDKFTQFMLLADAEEWMRVFAWERTMGNWDSWSLSTGQNMYLYAPLGEKARLIPWDVDFVLGTSGADGANMDQLFSAGQDAAVRTLINLPPYKRMMWRAYLDAVNGPLRKDVSDEQLDARRSMLLKNNVSTAANTGIKTYINARRNFIAGRISRSDAPAFVVNTQDSTTASSMATITGVAPFAVATIEINGVPHPAAWTGAGSTNWSVQVALNSGANLVRIVGKDLRGNIVPGADRQLTITYSGTAPRVEDWVVLHEIMVQPTHRNAQYVEIFNRHATHAFDLSGAQLRPLGFTFPPGTFILPRSFLTVARDSASFAAAYGTTIAIAGEMQTAPPVEGAVIQLVKASAPTGPEIVISEVRYEGAFPWPEIAARSDVSLQLVDAAQDTRRIENWSISSAAPFRTPGAPNSTIGILSEPAIWLNEIQPNNLSGLRDSTGQPKPWIEIHNPGLVPVSLDGYYLAPTPGDLLAWAFPTNMVLAPGEFRVIFTDATPGLSSDLEAHTSFALNQAAGAIFLSRLEGETTRVIDYLPYASVPVNHSYGSAPNGQPIHRQTFTTPTPAAANTAGSTALIITSITINAGELRLTWNSQSGRSYQVQASTDLTTATWQNAGAPVTATTPTTTATIAFSDAKHRFYRILLLPQ
ncbi:MAG TPA: lamin tail domain-containing protein [Methylomirabilota bacterium]|nr:lamin tail domain-containing protein [Methylomirabilota bacterium]